MDTDRLLTAIAHAILGVVVSMVLALIIAPANGATVAFYALWGVYLAAASHSEHSWGLAIMSALSFILSIGIAADEENVFPPETLFAGIVLLSMFWIVDHYFRADSSVLDTNWRATQVVEQREDGWFIGYQDSEGGDQRRWIVAGKNNGEVYSIDKDGNIQRGRQFFDTQQEALNAVDQFSDPLNEPEVIREDGEDETSRRWILKGGSGLLLAFIGVNIIEAMYEYATRDLIVSVDDEFSIPPEEYQYWEVEFNESVEVSYEYLVREGNTAQFLAMMQEEFEHYQSGERYRYLIDSGRSTGDSGSRVFEQGDYAFILDGSEDVDATVEFSLEGDPSIV
jgi:hypothetical protein